MVPKFDNAPLKRNLTQRALKTADPEFDNRLFKSHPQNTPPPPDKFGPETSMRQA